MGAPNGFSWVRRKSGEVEIRHHGRHATTLRGRKAEDFLEDIEHVSDSDAQERMARLTGNYRRGNERDARNHRRNRGTGGRRAR
ncbi:MAG: hypothetical protein AAF567_23405 [Actinomycetota bacterium]